MSSVGQREILTQQRVIALFRDTLGYRYLGNRKSRPDTRCDEGVASWSNDDRQQG